MSGSAVKANRRDIRRAFGEDAIGVIQSHEERLTQFKAELQSVKQYIAALDLAVSGRIAALVQRVEALERQTLRSRLKRLVKR